VAGSNASYLGQRDFEDFAPFLGWSEVTDGTTGGWGGTQITAFDGAPVVALQTDRYGIINLSTAAGTNEVVALARHIYYDLQTADIVVVEARMEAVADTDSPISFVGLTDQALPDDVFQAGVLDGGSNEDTIGLRWNADETIDIVAVDDGTLTVLKDDIGVTLLRTDGLAKLGLRIEKTTATQYRLTPYVNGVVAASGRVNAASTLLPENPMRPVVAMHIGSTTDTEFELDWIASGDK
jgi:hypothetical protein